MEEPRNGIDRDLEEAANELLKAHAKEIDPETGKPRTIKGKDPILFEEHIYMRKRREISNKTGSADPNLQRGIYNRRHPEGRKVNSQAQRSKHGSSYYK